MCRTLRGFCVFLFFYVRMKRVCEKCLMQVTRNYPVACSPDRLCAYTVCLDSNCGLGGREAI